MDFNIGDKVKIVDENVEGTVVKVSTYTVVIDIDGFEYQYPKTAVVKVNKDFEAFVSTLRPEVEKDKAIIHNSSSQKKNKKRQLLEIDLHIHEIIDDFTGIHKGEYLDIQLRYFERKLNEAIQQKVKRMIVIHGVGDGILKSEVRKILSQYHRLHFFDAPYRKYGYGATEIEFY